MRQIDDYIPIELWHESKNFLKDMSDNIEIYKKIKSFGSVRQNEEADKFVAWWEFKRYLDYPHALAVLYDSVSAVDETVGSSEVLDAFNQLQMRMVLFYRVLKEQEMIND